MEGMYSVESMSLWDSSKKYNESMYWKSEINQQTIKIPQETPYPQYYPQYNP